MTLGTYWPRSRGQSFFRNPPLAGFLRLSRVISRRQATDPHRHSADRTLSSPSAASYVARRTSLTRQSARLEPGAAVVPLTRARLSAKGRLRLDRAEIVLPNKVGGRLGCDPTSGLRAASVHERLRFLRRDGVLITSYGSTSSAGERSKALRPWRTIVRITPNQASPNSSDSAKAV